MSTLYIVATPIGNLEDITLRALRVLKEVDVIACEDTRHSKILLNHYGINKKTISCHAYNEDESSKGIVSLLDEGKNIAYISDAGTPGISDPGARLTDYVLTHSDHSVVPLPGPSAFVSLVSSAGNIGKSFTFEGFLPTKIGRRKKRLEELIERKEAFIIYESPYRVLKTLEEISSFDIDATVVMGRELTKIHEEIKVLFITKAISYLKEMSSIKGEFVLIIIPSESEYDNDQED